MTAPAVSAAAAGTLKRLRRPNADSSNAAGTTKPSSGSGGIDEARRLVGCAVRRSVRLSGA